MGGKEEKYVGVAIFFFCIYSATAPFRSLTAAVVSLCVRDRRARRATGAPRHR